MISRLIVVLLSLSFSSLVVAQIHEYPDSSSVSGVGKVFAITSSEFVNVTVESSNDIFAYVQSIPEQIVINIAKPEPEIISTTITIKNLAPETSYRLLKNGIAEVIVTDENGIYKCEADLSLPQKMVIVKDQ